MPTFSLHPSRTGTQTSAHEMAPPRPPRVENTLNKTLTRYMTTDEEVEEFLRKRFDSYPEYKFDLTVREVSSQPRAGSRVATREC